jgi:hypothetical protein
MCVPFYITHNKGGIMKDLKKVVEEVMEKRVNHLKGKELVSYYNRMVEGLGDKTNAKPTKKFSTKTAGLKRIRKVLGDVILINYPGWLEDEKEPELENQRKVSKTQTIRNMFKEKESWSREEIMDRTGFDSKNAHVCMGILKNGDRTKNPVLTGYDRKTKTYTLIKGE